MYNVVAEDVPLWFSCKDMSNEDINVKPILELQV